MIDRKKIDGKHHAWVHETIVARASGVSSEAHAELACKEVRVLLLRFDGRL